MASTLSKDQEGFSSALEIGSLGEGNTPLVKSVTLGKAAGIDHLFFKAEHMNPTGSFKDRFAAAELNLIRRDDQKVFFATSSGNTGSALAAYAARHQISCFLFVNEITPVGKLAQMMLYGAKVVRIKGFGVSDEVSTRVFDGLQRLATECDTRLIISAYEYSPSGMKGVETIAYELVDQLGGVPDYVFVPVGGGGMLTAIWRGFKDLQSKSVISTLPKIIAVQPYLNDTVVTPLREGALTARTAKTTTSISGLAVQIDIDATRALLSVKESGGWGILVPEAWIYDAQRRLSLNEGLFVEPAGAASVAGFLLAAADNLVGPREKVVCILSGHGFKDQSFNDPKAQRGSEVLDIEPKALNKALIQELIP